MISHPRLSGWVVLALATFFSSLLSAAETSRSPAVLPAAPSQELAIRLLALRDERFEKDYQVALIMPGETEFQDLTVANAAQVTYFGPYPKKGQKKRSLARELFLWNGEYGWFLCRFGERLGRTTVFLWSELQGEVEID